MSKPFLPSDLPKPDPLKLWRRSAVALAAANANRVSWRSAAEMVFGGETGAVDALVKAASSPASTGSWGGALAGHAIGAFLQSLAPTSAAARLFTVAARVRLEGANVATLPRVSPGFPEAAFVAEGAPIPAVTGALGGVELGPQRKLAAIAGLTNELASYSAEDAERVVSMAMQDAAGRALDAAVFSTADLSDVRPAGLLKGVVPIPSVTAPGGASLGFGREAMERDLSTLAGAIADAGGGTGILYFANPRQVTLVELRAPNFADKVVPTPRLPAGMVVAIETGGIASAFDGLPQVETATAATIHWEDASPAPISTAGAPNAVAAPVTSAFQTNMLALRLILRCAWANRLPGGVQVLTGATW